MIEHFVLSLLAKTYNDVLYMNSDVEQVYKKEQNCKHFSHNDHWLQNCTWLSKSLLCLVVVLYRGGQKNNKGIFWNFWGNGPLQLWSTTCKNSYFQKYFRYKTIVDWAVNHSPCHCRTIISYIRLQESAGSCPIGSCRYDQVPARPLRRDEVFCVLDRQRTKPDNSP